MEDDWRSFMFQQSPIEPAKVAAVRKRYDWLYRTLLEPRAPGAVQATLTVAEGSAASGYRTNANEMIIVVSGWDVDEIPEAANTPERPFPPDGSTSWPDWERSLHHEFVHEYDAKVVKCRPTQEGTKLLGEFCRQLRFEGEGHDASFFTAAADVARLLGFDVRAFINAL